MLKIVSNNKKDEDNLTKTLKEIGKNTAEEWSRVKEAQNRFILEESSLDKKINDFIDKYKEHKSFFKNPPFDEGMIDKKKLNLLREDFAKFLKDYENEIPYEDKKLLNKDSSLLNNELNFQHDNDD